MSSDKSMVTSFVSKLSVKAAYVGDGSVVVLARAIGQRFQIISEKNRCVYAWTQISKSLDNLLQ